MSIVLKELKGSTVLAQINSVELKCLLHNTLIQ